MVMKRYPNGAEGEFFYMKRAPSPRPEWIEICAIAHDPEVDRLPDRAGPRLAALGRSTSAASISTRGTRAATTSTVPTTCTSISIPVPGADFEQVREVALVVRDMLEALGMPPLAKTTGSKGIHVYIPIVRGPLQKEVWTFAKAIAIELERAHPAAHHGGVPEGEAAARAGARRLQPERLGTDAGVDLLGAADAASRRSRRR